MHVKHDYSHREGERYTTLEQLHLSLALESSRKPEEESSSAISDNRPQCCCLIACQSVDICPSNRGSVRTNASHDSLTKLHVAILDASQWGLDEDGELTSQLQQHIAEGVPIDSVDSRGQTALCYVKLLLEKDHFTRALHAAQLLLAHGARVDAEDSCKQTLLSHALSHLDKSVDLTRLLLNYGADVWNGTDFATSKDGSVHYAESPFSSFLQAVIRCRSLEGAELTARLLGRVMGGQPETMRSVVMRSMIRHGRHVRVMGPVFLQLKSLLSVHWRQPQQLQYGAWKAVRKAVGPKRLANSHQLKQLGLPSTIVRFLQMQD